MSININKSFRVLVAEWNHETNTFSPQLTSTNNFYQQYYYYDDDTILKERKNTESVYGATYEAAEKYNWKLFPTICASSNPSGRILSETFEELAGKILSRVEEEHKKVKLDGIILHLHGSMVSENYDDCEGELIKRIRKIVEDEEENKDDTSNFYSYPYKVPIICTLDLHGNISPTMASSCAALLAVRTYPHVDYYPIAQRACDLLQEAMEKKKRLVTFYSQTPVLIGLDYGKTYPNSPMNRLLDEIINLEKNGEIELASPCAGFTAGDVYYSGPSVTLTLDLENKNHQFDIKKMSKNDFLLLFNDNNDKVKELINNLYNNIENLTLDDEKYKMSLLILNGLFLLKKFSLFIWKTKNIRSEKFLTLNNVTTYCNNYLLKSSQQLLTYNKLKSNLFNEKNDEKIMKRPLVLADVSDNPGSGHYGDSTALLKKLLKEKTIDNVMFYSLFDPNCIKKLINLILKNKLINKKNLYKNNYLKSNSKFNNYIFKITTGCWQNKKVGSGPVSLYVKIKSISDGNFVSHGPMGFGGCAQNFGDSILLKVLSIVEKNDNENNKNLFDFYTIDDFNNIKNSLNHIKNNFDLILISNNGQLLDLSQVTSLGHSNKKIFNNHFLKNDSISSPKAASSVHLKENYKAASVSLHLSNDILIELNTVEKEGIVEDLVENIEDEVIDGEAEEEIEEEDFEFETEDDNNDDITEDLFEINDTEDDENQDTVENDDDNENDDDDDDDEVEDDDYNQEIKDKVDLNQHEKFIDNSKNGIKKLTFNYLYNQKKLRLSDIGLKNNTGTNLLLDKDIWVFKSKYHYRACTTPLSGDIQGVDGGGLGSVILSGGVYKNIREPSYPYYYKKYKILNKKIKKENQNIEEKNLNFYPYYETFGINLNII